MVKVCTALGPAVEQWFVVRSDFPGIVFSVMNAFVHVVMCVAPAANAMCACNQPVCL